MPVSLVTPSTRPATSSPNASRTSSSEADVSSTVSCSRAAHSVSVSSRMPAQIFATPTGWTMKSSPDWRRWSAWCSQANTNASITRRRSTWRATSSACSSTIANRSASSSRSVGVRSAGASAGAACSWSLRSIWLVGRDGDVLAVRSRPRRTGRPGPGVVCSSWSAMGTLPSKRSSGPERHDGADACVHARAAAAARRRSRSGRRTAGAGARASIALDGMAPLSIAGSGFGRASACGSPSRSRTAPTRARRVRAALRPVRRARSGALDASCGAEASAVGRRGSRASLSFATFTCPG